MRPQESERVPLLFDRKLYKQTRFRIPQQRVIPRTPLIASNKLQVITPQPDFTLTPKAARKNPVVNCQNAIIQQAMPTLLRHHPKQLHILKTETLIQRQRRPDRICAIHARDSRHTGASHQKIIETEHFWPNRLIFLQNGAIFGNFSNPTHRKSSLRQRLQRCHLRTRSPRMADIIRRVRNDEITTRNRNACIERRHYAAVFLLDQPKAFFFAQPAQQLSATIGGTIIHDDQLDRRIFLCKDTINRLTDETGMVVTQNHIAHQRPFLITIHATPHYAPSICG